MTGLLFDWFGSVALLTLYVNNNRFTCWVKSITWQTGGQLYNDTSLYKVSVF